MVDLEPVDQDDTLAMFFLCCHPALSQASAIALTLRGVGGPGTAQIAHAFLLPETTMAQRITRAKKKLATLRRPFAEPGGAEWHERLGTVLHVLYLIFNEGHHHLRPGPAPRRPVQRSDPTHPRGSSPPAR